MKQPCLWVKDFKLQLITGVPVNIPVHISSTGCESVRVTYILGIHPNGKKAQPLIITNGKNIILNVF